MKIVILLFFLIFTTGCSIANKSTRTLTDEPENPLRFRSSKGSDSYQEQLRSWRSPEDLNSWIGQNFKYDMQRAISLSETQKSNGKKLSIYTPAKFFEAKKGVCVDLSRFAHETLQEISPETAPQYLMIKFEPVKIKENILRLHWMTSFKRKNKFFFFADSKRPGTLSGPFDNPQDFIKKYEEFRGRKIVSFKLLDSYKKKKKEN